MTDKERILFIIIHRLALQYSLKLEYYKEPDGVYFAPWLGGFGRDEKLKSGMLVLCMTGRSIHNWTVGFLVEKMANTSLGGWVVREIGTNRLCNVYNESFLPIMGLSKIDLLEGDDYDFYQKVLKSFKRGGEYFYRFGGIEIIEKRKWKIYIRELFGGISIDHEKEESVPFYCIVKWNKKTSIKYILQKMREVGYGTKKFERREINDK
jgi:hypothetical protein